MSKRRHQGRVSSRVPLDGGTRQHQAASDRQVASATRADPNQARIFLKDVPEFRGHAESYLLSYFHTMASKIDREETDNALDNDELQMVIKKTRSWDMGETPQGTMRLFVPYNR